MGGRGGVGGGSVNHTALFRAEKPPKVATGLVNFSQMDNEMCQRNLQYPGNVIFAVV